MKMRQKREREVVSKAAAAVKPEPTEAAINLAKIFYPEDGRTQVVLRYNIHWAFTNPPVDADINAAR